MAHGGKCHDCGKDYQRLKQHWAMSSCEPDEDNPSKKTYICAECDSEFEDYPSRRETRGRETYFCSRDCKDEYQSDEVLETQCINCGDELYLPEWRFESSDGYPIKHHFCGKECESEWKKENWVGENHPTWDGGKIETDCEECGDTFLVKPYKFNDPTIGRFCSEDCFNKYQTSDLVELECPWCGDGFEKEPWLVRHDNTFCSRKCYKEWLSEVRKGDKNPAWDGGKADWYGTNWPQQRRAALERDGFECQSCSMDAEEHREKYTNQLNIHHITRFKDFDSWEEANRLDNLITLCHGCHKAAEQLTRDEQLMMFGEPEKEDLKSVFAF